MADGWVVFGYRVFYYVCIYIYIYKKPFEHMLSKLK